jgi:hypothetical protein
MPHWPLRASFDPLLLVRPGRHMRRREFISLLSGTAAFWPVTGRAQQASKSIIGFLGVSLRIHGPVGSKNFIAGWVNLALSRDKIFPLNIAGLTGETNYCRQWHLIWSASK